MSEIDTDPGAEPAQLYDRIKARLLAYMPTPMQLLQINALADELGTSTTPVREALTRLAAERVIVYLPKKGFFAKTLSEDELRELYIVNKTLLHCALHAKATDGPRAMGAKKKDLHAGAWRNTDRSRITATTNAAPKIAKVTPSPGVPQPDAGQLAQLTAQLFVEIAMCSENREVIEIVSNINDRLHHARVVEQHIIPGAREELSQLDELHNAAQREEMLHALVSYHERRLQFLSPICKELLFRPFSSLGRNPASQG